MTISLLSTVVALLLSPANLAPPAPTIDLDNDGVADVLSATPTTNTVKLTGASNTVLRTFLPPAGQGTQSFGAVARLVPDISGDGKAELVVLAPGASPQGAVDLFDPVTGTRLWRSLGPVATSTSDGWWFQNDVMSVDDQNDDGKPDILVEASPDGGGPKFTAILDGATGRLLAVRNLHPSDLIDLVNAGTRLYRATDINDDGLVNSNDFAEFLNRLMNADPRADLNSDGMVNSIDLTLMMSDLLDGATTMMAGGSSGSGGSSGGGGSGGTGGGLSSSNNQVITVTSGSCTTLWTSTSGYNPCSATCTPIYQNAVCNTSGTGNELFRYFSSFCGGDGYGNLITHRTGELTVQRILAQLVQMHNTQTGTLASGSAAIAEVPCVPNDGIDWSDVLAFAWSTDQPLLVNATVANGGTSLMLKLGSYTVHDFALVNIYFHVWVRDQNNDVHLCCFRIPFTVLPDCASVTMAKADNTTTASPLLCPGIIVENQPIVIGATFFPLGGVARWTITYTMPAGGSVTTTNVGPTAIVAAPTGSTAVDIAVDYQYGTVWTCGPASDTAHFTVDHDSDHDGIPDSCELTLHSTYPCLDPHNADSDGDGFSDGVELALGSDPCNPKSIPDISIDTDGDGLTDYEEVAIYHTDPRRVDTDNDGADDFGEVELMRMGYPFNPLDPFSVSHALGLPQVRDGYTSQWKNFDQDGDHMFDLLEEMRGLRTDRADSDGDGIPDGVELRAGMDPLRFDPGVGDGFGTDDSDGDGVSDQLEIRLGLDPHNADSDGDGLMDGFEIQAGLDPLNGDTLGASSGTAAATADGYLDSDGDGLTNLQEQMYGTNANDADTDFDGVSDGAEIAAGTSPVFSGFSTQETVTFTIRVRPARSEEYAAANCWRSLGYTVHFGRLAVPSPHQGQTSVTMIVPKGTALPYRIAHRGAEADMTHPCDTWINDPYVLPGLLHQALSNYRDFDFDILLNGVSAVGDRQTHGWSLQGGNAALLAANEDSNWGFLGGDSVNNETDPGSYIEAMVLVQTEGNPQEQQAAYQLIANDLNEEEAITNHIDRTRGFYIVPRLVLYDLREFSPVSYSTTQFKFLNSAFTVRPNAEVAGVSTDGSSLCLLREDVSPEPYANWRDDVPMIVGVYRLISPLDEPPGPGQPPPPSQWPTTVSVGGGFMSSTGTSIPLVDANGMLMPIDKGFADGQLTGLPDQTYASTTLVHGCAIYRPPTSYLSRTQNAMRLPYDWLPDGPTAQMGFGVGLVYSPLDITKFVLRHPPVVLIHGINSSASGLWPDWQPYSSANPDGIPACMYFADWGQSGAKGFSENVEALAATIGRAIEEARSANYAHQDTLMFNFWEHDHPDARYKWVNSGRTQLAYSKKIATTRVDVIAHSQGGQIARMYLSDLWPTDVPRQIPGAANGEDGGWPKITLLRTDAGPTSVYENNVPLSLEPQNYYCGYIGKLITLGSPFRGSPFADYAEPKMRPNQHVRVRPRGDRDGEGDYPQTDGDIAELNALISTVKAPNKAVCKSPDGKSTCYYDLRTDGVAVSLLRQANYPAAARWYPTFSVGYQPASGNRPADPLPTLEVIHSCFRDTLFPLTGDFVLPSDTTNLTKWMQCSDGIVSVWSQLNMPLPGNNRFNLDVPAFAIDTAPSPCISVHPVYHSGLGPGMVGEGAAPELRVKVIHKLSEPTDQWLHGVNLGDRR